MTARSRNPRPSGRGGSQDLYYLSAAEGGAVGETMAQHPQWTSAILDFKALPGSVLSLCTFVIDDDVRLLDMDDAQTLQDFGLRPTQIVTRNRAVTQRWDRRIWEEHDFRGRTWDGIRWWSRHHAEWPVFAVWNTGLCKVDDIAPLTMDHRAVRDAAKILNKAPVTT